MEETAKVKLVNYVWGRSGKDELFDFRLAKFKF